jgi:hypothetical protein
MRTFFSKLDNPLKNIRSSENPKRLLGLLKRLSGKTKRFLRHFETLVSRVATLSLRLETMLRAFCGDMVAIYKNSTCLHVNVRTPLL